MPMQTLGELLRELRRKRGLTQERLAQKAQVTARVLRYWESNGQLPRETELLSVLTALEATAHETAQIYALLPDRRSVHRVSDFEQARNIPTAVLGQMPGLGDLLRAMRLRRGWTQEKFAEEMRVSRSSVLRWEATRTLPSDEDMERLFLILNATDEEQAALRSRRLLPASWLPQLTLEQCLHQYDLLVEIRSGNTMLLPLSDLYALALKRQIRFLLNQSPEALRLLAKLEVYHGWWLAMQGRVAESCAGNWRALNMVRGNLVPEYFWVGALNLLSAHAANGTNGAQNAVRLLYPWLRLLPHEFHYYLLCDMALYSGRAQQSDEALRFLQQTHKVRDSLSRGEGNTEWYRDWYYQMTMARVLLDTGKAGEALNWLPATELKGDGRFVSLLVWAEACLAAGEKNLASGYLHEVQTHLVTMPLPQRQMKLEQLAQHL